MIYLLICVQILWLGVSGHSISKLQINNGTSDVYEINEDKASNTITFVNPKTEHQTLREIVYYHLIERPYGDQEKESTGDKEGPDFDETVRPFTNSHGLPFLEEFKEESTAVPNEEDDDDDNDEEYIPQEDDSDETDSHNSSKSEPEEVLYEYYEEEIEDAETGSQSTDDPNVSTPETEDANADTQSINKPTISTAEKPDDTVVEVNAQEEKEATTPPREVIPPMEDVTVSDSPAVSSTTEEVLEDKAKHARNLLFDRIKERYHSQSNKSQIISPSTSSRKKRDINMHIPEAPRLGPINYDILPPYLRQLISTEKPKRQGRNYEPESNEDKALEEIKRKMESMMARLKSSSGSENEKEEPAPRTYGMNLTEDHGYVWNNMWSQPGVHFNIEASESIEEIQKPDVDNSKHEDSKESAEDKKKSESEKELKEEDEKKKEEEDKNIENVDKTVKDDDPINNIVETENSSENQGRRRNKDKNKETTIDELLENEQFWKWLADWTSVYMDVLGDHIKETVQEEVSNQIQLYSEAHKVEEPKPPKDDDKEKSDKVDPEINNTEKDDTNPDTHKEEKDADSNNPDIDEEKSNRDINEENPKTNDVENDEEMLKKRKNKEDKNKPNQNYEHEPSHNDNAEEKPDSSNDKKEKRPSKVEAQNIYGNSVGSDKVTNIFIFYPNSETKLINEIKNISDSDNSQTNVYGTPIIDERINVPDKEKENKPIETPKEEISPSKDETESPEPNVDTKHTEKKEIEGSETPINAADVGSNDKDTSTTENPKEISSTDNSKQPEETVSTDKPEVVPSTESSKVEITTKPNGEHEIKENGDLNDKPDKEIKENDESNENKKVVEDLKENSTVASENSESTTENLNTDIREIQEKEDSKPVSEDKETKSEPSSQIS